MSNKVKMSEVMSIASGQIMSRVVADEKYGGDAIGTCRVIVPKAILSDGTIDLNEIQEEKIRLEIDPKRLTKVGDIVIKLSTPYDSAIITEETAGCVIPSFCALIENNDRVDKNYLQAFLSSNNCKEQLKKQVAGATVAILSIGKVREVFIPLPDMSEQVEIGNAYVNTQKKLVALKQIVNLETKKLDLIFRNLGDEQ